MSVLDRLHALPQNGGDRRRVAIHGRRSGHDGIGQPGHEGGEFHNIIHSTRTHGHSRCQARRPGAQSLGETLDFPIVGDQRGADGGCQHERIRIEACLAKPSQHAFTGHAMGGRIGHDQPASGWQGAFQRRRRLVQRSFGNGHRSHVQPIRVRPQQRPDIHPGFLHDLLGVFVISLPPSSLDCQYGINDPIAVVRVCRMHWQRTRP